MGKVISISRGKKDCPADISEDFNQLLETVLRSSEGKKEYRKIETVKNPEEFIREKISSFLLENKIINPEIFRCSLYVSKVVSNYFSTVPDSYYACDYFLKGINENNPGAILQGADFCFLLCAFFPARGNRKKLKVKYYSDMGRMMYFSFYDKTRKTIGLSMGNEFSGMVEIVQKTIVH